ncbi:MAG TPA: glycosyltransferase family 2 protein [Xanthobacteraceae bacterium]|nr:glycosyltransferase family 2 protein [Xanthobacteraceae bacterium]
MLDQITPIILTFNEEANIARTLDRLLWARDIIVVDSFSTDATVSILSRFKHVRLFQRTFDSHEQQWNFAIDETHITSEWFLALDADYVLSPELVVELSSLRPKPGTNGYFASFHYCVGGAQLCGTLYPSVTVLCRRGKVRYEQDGHTQRAIVDGAIAALDSRIFHDDRKPLSRWIVSQQRYAQLEAEHLLTVDKASLALMDRIRLWGWLAPIIVFLYTLVAKGCLLDGWRGWFYVLQRTYAEVLLALDIVDRRLRLTSDKQS